MSLHYFASRAVVNYSVERVVEGPVVDMMMLLAMSKTR